MKKFAKILTACAALTLLAGCEKKNDSTQPADDGGNTPAVVDVAVESVSLNKHETSIYLGEKERLTATIAPENATNKLLNWSSSNEDLAVVSATGQVTALGTGDVTIKAASQADPTKYDECVVHISVKDTTVHVSSVEITEESFALDIGGTTTAKPTVTVLPENATNKAITWSSSDPSKVLVDSATNTIVAVAVTTEPVIITATSVDDSTKSDSVSVTVVDTTDHNVHVSSVSIPETLEIDLKNSDTAIVTAEVLPANAGNKNIQWSLSSEGVVELTPVGASSVSVHALATGTVTLTATSEDNSEKVDTCTITVTDTTVVATGVSVKLNGDEITTASVELNKNITLDASVLPVEADNREIEWEIASADEQYLTLSSKTSASILVIAKKVTETPVTLTAKAKSDPTKSKSVTVSVVDPTDVDRFVSFIDPVDYQHYLGRVEENALNDIEGVDTNETIAKGNFFAYDAEDADKALYKVGDQGNFRFALGGSVLKKGDEEPTNISNIETNKRLYVEGSEGYELVTLDDYVTIDENGIDYAFKPSAVGKKLKLEFTPGDQYYTKTTKTYEFEFQVIHGYNVDSLAELSLFDNSQAVWNDYKIASGLGGVTAKGGIVLHKDIEIVSSILPSEFVESADDLAKFKVEEADDEYKYWVSLFDSAEEADEAFVGSLKDCKAILNRDTHTEDFSLEGNFFSVKCDTLKTIADLSGGFEGDGSHTSLFNINNLDMIDGAVGPATSEEVHDITLRNFQVKANGGLVTLPDKSVSEFEKGGLIAFKMDSARVHVENAIVSQAFTAFMLFDDQDHHLTHFDADRVIGYDSYNSVFYVHGTDDNTLSNSWVSKAGGPLVLLDENDGSSHTKVYSNATMDCTNCYMHNLVTGTEPWFAGHAGATGMVQGYITNPGSPVTDWSDQDSIKAHWYYAYASQVAQQTQTVTKSIANATGFCDFVAIDVNARHFADNTEQNLEGHFTLNNGDISKNANMQMSTVAKTITGEYSSTCPFPNWSSPSEAYLVSSANGGNMLVDMATNNVKVVQDPEHPEYFGHFVSDYVNVFLNPAATAGTLGAVHGRYISIVLGTFPLA